MGYILFWLDLALLVGVFVVGVAFFSVAIDPRTTIRQPHGVVMGALALAALAYVYFF